MMKRVLLSLFTSLVLLPVPEVRAQQGPPPEAAAILGTVQAYLAVLERMGQFSSDPRAALLLAQNSIKDIYEEKGQKAQAVPELRKILQDLDDPAVRTAVRFAIADIYKETGQKDQALEELRQIVAENKALLGSRRR
jgi:thioredoxin-like negative regulator of GroEL